MIEEEFKEESNPQSENKWLIYFLVTIITLPVFLILKGVIPNFNWPIHLDSIILFILTWSAINLLISPFKKVVYLLVVLIALFLLYGSVFGEYGIGRFITDYKELIANMKKSDDRISTLVETLTPDNTYKYQEIVDRVDLSESVIFEANKRANSFDFYLDAYPEYSHIIKCLSVFKETKEKWIFIKDLEPYNAYANESVETLSGDIDDYAILMCAFIKSIGAQARIKNQAGVFHPELCIGAKDDKSKIKRLIKTRLFSDESEHQEIEFDVDAEGRIWLSLSFYANFPGRAIFKKGSGAPNSEIINLNLR